MMMNVLAHLAPWRETLEKQQQRVSKAKEALTRAGAEVEAAQTAFDEDGSSSSRKRLKAAEEAAADARLDVESAERNLSKATTAHTEAERAARQDRAAELRAQLDDRRKETALTAESVKVARAFVASHMARRAHLEERAKLERELYSLDLALGADPASHRSFSTVDPSLREVAETLFKADVQGRPKTPESDFTRELADLLYPNFQRFL